MNSTLKLMAQENFPTIKSDLFSIFIEKILHFSLDGGLCGIMSPFVWLFLKSYEELRKLILFSYSLRSLVQPEYHSFFESAYVPICAFTVQSISTNYRGTFFDLTSFYGAEEQPKKFLEAIKFSEKSYRHTMCQLDFQNVPGSAIAYWVGIRTLTIFKESLTLGEVASPRQGLATGDNSQFLRLWSEVSIEKVKFDASSRKEALDSKAKWFPYNKGGAYRKWYGNHEWVVNWEEDGKNIRQFGVENGERPRSRAQNTEFYFHESLSWSKVTVGGFSVRYFPPGFVFDVAGCSMFETKPGALPLLACTLNSVLTKPLLSDLAQTLNFEVGQVENFPIIRHWENMKSHASQTFDTCLEVAKQDWNSFETSWDFKAFPFLTSPLKTLTIGASWNNWQTHCIAKIKRMQELETENNSTFIEAYGLQDELTPEVQDEQITLARADREKDIKRLISYAIGCMMGRYSLDKPGLVYAHSGNNGFDHSQYKTFPADQDGIIPVMEADWFSEDASNRIVEFIGVAWSRKHLEENLRFIAESLGPNKGEQPQDTIRRYLTTGFFKDHLKTYKKRPIYWLFSSGKLRAFQCLVYLHRYNEGTLSRMRTEYVIPLQGKMASRLEQLSGDIQKASSTSHRKKMEKERDSLVKQQAELQSFDEKLRHYADMRISLDLDDGVKVNYGKFGDLLAEVKTVTGGSQE